MNFLSFWCDGNVFGLVCVIFVFFWEVLWINLNWAQCVLFQTCIKQNFDFTTISTIFYYVLHVCAEFNFPNNFLNEISILSYFFFLKKYSVRHYCCLVEYYSQSGYVRPTLLKVAWWFFGLIQIRMSLKSRDVKFLCWLIFS